MPTPLPRCSSGVNRREAWQRMRANKASGRGRLETSSGRGTLAEGLHANEHLLGPFVRETAHF